MTEKTHAELQRWHYEAVRENLSYRAAGLMDCEAELIALNTPLSPDLSEIEDRLNDMEALLAEKGSIPRRFHEEVQQLRGQVEYLHGKVVEQRKATKKTSTKGAHGKYRDIRV